MDTYPFGEDRFDLASPEDREVLRFVLSQALYGEATGVYCGKSLYAARSLEAARFYVKQAHAAPFGANRKFPARKYGSVLQ